jgi:hypothetical protein
MKKIVNLDEEIDDGTTTNTDDTTITLLGPSGNSIRIEANFISHDYRHDVESYFNISVTFIPGSRSLLTFNMNKTRSKQDESDDESEIITANEPIQKEEEELSESDQMDLYLYYLAGKAGITTDYDPKVNEEALQSLKQYIRSVIQMIPVQNQTKTDITGCQVDRAKKSVVQSSVTLPIHNLKETIKFSSIDDDIVLITSRMYSFLGLRCMKRDALWEIICSEFASASYANEHKIDSVKNTIEETLDKYLTGPTDDDTSNYFDLNILNYNLQQEYNVGKQYLLDNPTELRKAPYAYLKDKEIVLNAVNYNWLLLEHIPDEMRDLDLCKVAVEESMDALRYFSLEVYENDPDIIYQLKQEIFHCRALLKYAPDSLKEQFDK